MTAAAPRGIIIAAPRSGAGKTTVTLGLLRALARRGLRVQPFKCGPDYIDLAFHSVAAERTSYNLDSWAMSEAQLTGLVSSVTADADIAVVEGVMGLFDGAPQVGRAGRGSAADLAALLGWPVVLVLDVSGQTETAAAVALGCARFRDDVEVAGVILNRVASERHRALIAPAFATVGIGILGALARDGQLTLPERHLGLVQAQEISAIETHLDRLATQISTSVDLDAVLALARPMRTTGRAVQLQRFGIDPPGQRIAQAADAAFSFSYPHLLRHWQAAGAEIVPFSPLNDEAPDPAADAVWLPGGYPELHAGRLASAGCFLGGLRAMASRGVPIHGECGGYMTLGAGLEDAHGVRHAMSGLLSLETSFAKRRLHLGYRRAALLADCSLGPKGTVVHGHEFHYATILQEADDPLIDCRDATGRAIAERGARRGTVTGTFLHVLSGESA
ncbi:hydrogenobyrinate a,c-diamide synthase [Bradyrhizobium sp. SSBR45G]|uniref:cobyrinate a,c-diamide synthase n=1 Tax=unclassified Bradyrhizobium TaxID=2631580 RepID=UPI002342A4FB|nr:MULTISPECIES: cobyrinate a,c-diamide synthase [unclassified Bradyrhizobium]GLH79377.1 hydrogenobyrinate a,c-diamide synthase [Bradyrhizobium sp. SSBR45G]GLH86687.1 hydrogenobyrinate a,c-diamide synthase [Bradyrhizobium sp. SSBR45R]